MKTMCPAGYRHNGFVASLLSTLWFIGTSNVYALVISWNTIRDMAAIFVYTKMHAKK